MACCTNISKVAMNLVKLVFACRVSQVYETLTSLLVRKLVRHIKLCQWFGLLFISAEFFMSTDLQCVN